MIYRLAASVLLSAFCATAQGAISLSLAPNFDSTRTTAYPNGDKPDVTCVPPATWTEVDIGDGFGEVCDTTGEWVFAVGGTTFRQNAHLIYKDAGAADVQFEGTVEDDYAGATGNNAGLGIGLREAATQASYIFQIHSTNAGAPQVECTYGANGSYTTVEGSAGETRPTDLGVTYDVSSGDLKAFAGGLEVCSQNRAMSDVLAYGVGQSKSITETLTATLTAPTLGTTIDLYTPSDPPGGSPPVLTSAIPNQTGTQGNAFSLTFSSYFTGATSYSTTAFPASSGLSETSDGVVSGTISAADVSASPYSEDLCATNASGTTCDTVQFSFSPVSGSGSTFTVPDVGDVLSTFNCATTGGANGSTWTSVRTSGSNTRPLAGDIIEITSGSRGATHFQNCNGDAGGYITIRKTASATRLTITGTGSGADALLCEDCTYVHFNGLVNWTGNTGGCGSDSTLSETPLDDCGILVDTTAQFAVKLRGKAQNIIVEGIEADGNWPIAVTLSGSTVAFSPNDQGYCVDQTPGDTDGDGTANELIDDIEFRNGLVLRNSYFHHFSKEIVYFGPNVNYGNCGTGEDTPRLKDITISGNFLQYAGWDGLNLKSAFTGTNVVERNVVLDIGGGTTASGANSVGISLFESEGIVRYNKVRRTSDPPGGANGINCSNNNAPSAWGDLDCQVYGNDVSDTDGHCVKIGRSKSGAAYAGRTADVDYNTLTDCGGGGVDVASLAESVSITNNISAGEPINLPAGSGTQSNNMTTAESSVGFVDHANNDYRLQSGSAARNGGAATGCPSTDIYGTSRPQGTRCDQGAYEFDE